jgi:hypothetical protein
VRTRTNTPAEHEAFLGCGTDPIEAACLPCTVLVKGRYRQQPYRIVRSAERDGDRCGYRVYEITCLDNWWGDLFSRRPRH